MADELDRSEEQGEPPAPGSEAHLPSPTIWPFAFAAGIALVLVGLIVNWIVAAIGAAIAVVFGFLWIREATREIRGTAPPPASEMRLAEAEEEGAEGEIQRYSRTHFLEGATLGVGALIGGLVTSTSGRLRTSPRASGRSRPFTRRAPT